MRRRPSHARRLVLKARRAREQAHAKLRSAFAREPSIVTLESVQRRLELLITALYGRPLPIVAKDADTTPWISKLRTTVRERGARRAPPDPAATIILPPAIAAGDDEERALARFRLFAIEQAERIVRGTAALVPLDDPLERDLFLLHEAQAIDAGIARANPGLAPVLAAERAAALGRRPKLERMRPGERDVELLVREALASDPAAAPSEISHDAAASLAWAREMAAGLRARAAEYRGVPQAEVWGPVRSSPGFTDPAKHYAPPPRDDEPPPPAWAMGGAGVGDLESRASPTGGGGDSGEDGRADPFETYGGSGSAAPSGQTNAQVASDQVSERSGPRGSSGEGAAPPTERRPRFLEPDELRTLPPAIAFPEWDSAAGAYVPHAALVRLYASDGGDDAWAATMLRDHAALVREIRHRFERLRGRRMLLPRRRAGDEIDFDAVIDAMVDRNTGRSPDDRLYLEARPARRGIAIELLADVSGSTATPVDDDMRVVDLEKLALLLASEALDALGDSYAMHTFAGRSAENVKITPIKTFAERNGPAVRRRIAALEPGGFTRLGAAVRFATRQLARESAGRRLLLILSDGRPNDVDQYQSTYGVDDARQAIVEARAAGIYPFCVTIDREGSEYLPRIFGAAGHTIVRHPRQLPAALLRATSALIHK
ncbi:MAG TPA: VWA domain-containing protein [Gemmatimonadaceae bacterium]|nr:VWA domain-containing protein [Gemmatimonadaceae bacterium]